MGRDGGDGWRPLEAVPRIAVGVLAVPVVAAFVVLGAGVLVLRSVRSVARETWGIVPAWRGSGRRSRKSGSDTA